MTEYNSILSEVQSVLASLSIPIETGAFKSGAPDTYIVVVPMTDTFALHADDMPEADVQEVRLSIYAKGNYQSVKNNVVRALLTNDFVITLRRYNGYEADTGYYHYTVDAAKAYTYRLEETT